MPAPIVFISSTVEDLKPYRQAARDAAIKAGFLPRMLEYFTSSGARPPLDACLSEIAGSETKEPSNVLVVIVAHRYGWVPEGQSGSERKSITRLECEQAIESGQEVLAFLVDDGHPWPSELREEYRLAKAALKGEVSDDLVREVQQNLLALRDFEGWLSSRGIRATFTTAHSLRAEVSPALHDWLDRHPEYREAEVAPGARDPTKYLRFLREDTSHIDIRGLEVGSGRATRLGIEELYIPLTTMLHEERRIERGKGKPAEEAEAFHSVRTELDHALSKHRLLAVVGDPGSGKTTFLRRTAFLLCQTCLGEKPEAAKDKLGLEKQPFPIFIRIAELGDHIAKSRDRNLGPVQPEAPMWLVHFLAAKSEGAAFGLNETFFRDRLEKGTATVLLDGLDEAATEQQRKQLAKLVENAARAFPECRFVLTSRPAAYRGEAVLPDFAQVQIETLEDEAIRTFLARWCEALFPQSPSQAQRHLNELVGALKSRVDIRRLARNPVKLTALAVVHWNEKRLPEQRADLYESIINWLACSRERLPGRPSAERCIELHQELALAMQDHPDGRRVQVPRYWAAEKIGPEWPELPEAKRTQRAEQFLIQEESDSGIVVGRGDDVRFWHLTFGEFLAARALAGRPEADQRELLFSRPQLYRDEWREVVLLLAGVLYHQGRRRVDAMFSAILDRLGDEASLADQATCFGLLGAAVRDLAPVKYEPADPRYKRVADAVMGIFDRRRPESVPIETWIASADALGQAGDPRIDPQRDDYWVTIPADKFLMGAQSQSRKKPNYDEEASDYESPVREVDLDQFSIARYPVTVGQYGQFVKDEGYQEKRWWAAGGFGEFSVPKDWEWRVEYPSRPVVGVSWHEAAAFCAWAGFRLPTEAEWERAARGTEGRRYPWGNEPAEPSRLNYRESKIGYPTPVGIYPLGATPEGICDMAGNVWEWCRDWYGHYRAAEQGNPTGPMEGGRRVVRGGCWSNGARGCRSAYRVRGHPTDRGDDVGFRLVL